MDDSGPPPPSIVSSTPTDTLEFARDLSNEVPHIGQLKELGVDFGFGPSGIMLWFYEHVHVYSGLEWGPSIILGAAIYRILILGWPMLIASDQFARLHAIAPVTNELWRQKNKDLENPELASQAGTKYSLELNRIRKAAKVTWMKQFSPTVIQAFLGFGTLNMFQHLSKLPAPGFEDEGILWIKDLTVGDPYNALPLLFFGTMHLSMKYGVEIPHKADMQTIQRAVSVGLPFLGAFFMWFQPGALQLSLLTTSLLNIAMTQLMRWPEFRRLMGLYPIPTNASAPAEPTQQAPSSPPEGKLIVPPMPHRAAAAPEKVVSTPHRRPAKKLNINAQKVVDQLPRGVRPVIVQLPPSEAFVATQAKKAKKAKKAAKIEVEEKRLEIKQTGLRHFWPNLKKEVQMVFERAKAASGVGR